MRWASVGGCICCGSHFLFLFLGFAQTKEWRSRLIFHLQVFPPRQTQQNKKAFSPPHLLSFQLSSQAPWGLCSAWSRQQGPAICQMSSGAALHTTSPAQTASHTHCPLGTHSLTVYANSQYLHHLQTWAQVTEVHTVSKRVQINFRRKIARNR